MKRISHSESIIIRNQFYMVWLDRRKKKKENREPINTCSGPWHEQKMESLPGFHEVLYCVKLKSISDRRPRSQVFLFVYVCSSRCKCKKRATDNPLHIGRGREQTATSVVPIGDFLPNDFSPVGNHFRKPKGISWIFYIHICHLKLSERCVVRSIWN